MSQKYLKFNMYENKLIDFQNLTWTLIFSAPVNVTIHPLVQARNLEVTLDTSSFTLFSHSISIPLDFAYDTHFLPFQPFHANPKHQHQKWA